MTQNEAMTDNDRAPEGQDGTYGQQPPEQGPEQPGGPEQAGGPEQIPGKAPWPASQQQPGQPQQPGYPQQGYPQQGYPQSGQPYGLGQPPAQGPGYGDEAPHPGSPRYYPSQPGYPYQYSPNNPQHVTPSYAAPPPVVEPGKKNKGRGKLIAGLAVLALVFGGAAGGVGGYLAGGGGGDSVGSTSLGSVPAKDDSPAPKGSTEAVVQKVMPSVVQVKVPTPRGLVSGSGFIISSNGYIMTNNHVVAPAAKSGSKIVVVLADGRKGAAKIIGRDPTTDIAVIQVKGFDSLNPAELGRSGNLDVGQSVVAIGSPFRLSGTVTEGIVSALHRPVRSGGGEGELATVMDAIQTDAAINPGNSGGPLVNMNGEVIGINSAIYSPGAGSPSGGPATTGNVGIGFAIPIDQARRTAEEIINTGHATQTFLGATVTNVDKRGGGALIVEVHGAPAEKAGLKKGDVIVKIGDRNTDTIDALIAAIRTKAPGTTVTLTLKDGSTVDVKLGGKPVHVN